MRTSKRATDAVECLVREGTDAAMNCFKTRRAPQRVTTAQETRNEHGDGEGESMRPYETLMVLHRTYREAQVRETIDRARRLIEGRPGRCARHAGMGHARARLSDPKAPRGYYVLAEYTATAEIVRELERTLKIADEVLRFVSWRGDDDSEQACAPGARPTEPAEAKAVAAARRAAAEC